MARRFVAALLTAALSLILTLTASAQERQKIGVAFGGGSAKGIAHVGVIRWFEEHRIPIDVAAGTSMGGLIGGCYATGMSAAELDELLSTMNWDELFGSSNFAFKNIRRKADARAYPSRLEFGLRKGFSPPTSLNSGEQVDMLIARVTAPYYGIATFDELPTPFRAVAVDLLSATQVVLDRGSLASAMRATMSLPLIFPAVEADGKILVDGGAMNNVPADVTRRMGADVVIAINVGDLSDPKDVNHTLFGLAGGTLSAMMRASTKAGLATADLVLDVPLVEQGYKSLDWRLSKELIEEGYKAAEAIKDQLLKYAVSEAEYQTWVERRNGARRTTIPAPAFVRFEGVVKSDEQRMEATLDQHIGRPLDIPSLELDLTELGGLDRYEGVVWRLVSNQAGEVGLLVRARQKPNAPPFLMLGFTLENTTSDSFGVSLSARYLNFDLPFSGAELRVDGTVGSDPSVGVEWYQPLGKTPLFFAPYGGVAKRTYNFVEDESVVARYDQVVVKAGVNVGVNLGAFSDLRLGAYIGRLDADVEVGDPGLPSLTGKETAADLTWRYNGQDSPAIPSRGVATSARMLYIFDGPVIDPPLTTARSSENLAQFQTTGSSFHTVGSDNRVFTVWGLGTSFDNSPLTTNQFHLGQPFRLGAYDLGELRGDHYYVGTFGYLHQLGRLPDFLGGSILAGAWLENGDAFDDWDKATFRTQAGFGLMADTLIGPVLLGGTVGFDGRWATYIAVGRLFNW
ncbi:MAG: patatin-like phospholipase family protein [Vicinamibacterales bacterium]